ncbi:MAG: phosphate acetyltransferase, partial [Candidatus Puniceispirillum sp.]
MSVSQTNPPQNSAPSAFLSDAKGDCPPDLLARASSDTPPAYVFVRAIGEAVLQTAWQAHEANLIRPILVGEPDIIAEDARELGWNLDGIEIVESTGEQGAIDAAIRLIQNGSANGLIKGQLHTDVFMGGIVKRDAGIRIGKRLVHIFAMLP